MNFLFNGGCIWGFFEYIGAIQYIKEKGLKIGKLYGVSAGSAIALCVLLDIDIRELTNFCTHTVNTTKFKSLTEMHIMGCEFVLNKYPAAYKLANNRLYIGLTNENGFCFKNKYKSNTDLANAIICSSSIPIVSSYDTICDNHNTIDGGFSFCQTCIPKNTIVIRPTTPFPMSAIPPTETLQRLLTLLGYRNIEEAIKNKNIFVGEVWYSDPVFLPLWFYLHRNACMFDRKSILDVHL